MESEILFEDDTCLVANKRSGLPCLPLKAGERNNLLYEVSKTHPEVLTAFTDKIEGGVCHRLDNDTSGVVLIAKTPEAHTSLREQVKDGEIIRVYLALVQGKVDVDFEINWPIAHHAKKARKMSLAKPGYKVRGKPKDALTLVESVQMGEGATLVRVKIEGGRRHQVRVHLAGAGYPLIGDVLYSGPRATHLKGHTLHALSLEWPQGTTVYAPLTEAFMEEAKAHGIVLDNDQLLAYSGAHDNSKTR